MSQPSIKASLAQRLPFYYGWVILSMASLPGFGARPLMSVAALSVFVVPMTEEFGWSRGLFSGAVSLGAVCGLVMSPFAGRLIDRYGSGSMLAAGSALVGVCAIGLAAVSQVWTFYAIYVPGRAVFSSPLELGTSTAVSNWFIRRRPFALAVMGVGQGVGLTIFPVIVQLLINGWGWRTAWASLGVFTLLIGIAPALLFMARRPEDMGLEVDARPRITGDGEPGSSPQGVPSVAGAPALSEVKYEVNYTVREAVATKAFWMLSIFSLVGFVVQSGVSLHQVPHYIGQGVPAHLAAFTSATFAFGQIPGLLFWSVLARRVPVRVLLATTAVAVAAGAAGTAYSGSLDWGIPSAFTLGVGVGGFHILFRLAWADYYGRVHLGAIRGLTLPFQIGGQAIGPVVAGFMFDATGDYWAPFTIFAIAVAAAALLAMAATPPGRTPGREAALEETASA